jgi:hypothetical protein
MTGSVSQIEWAEAIKQNADAEFDRVADAFRKVALTQVEPERAETRSVIAVLEEKRAEVMARQDAGYFMSTWRELTDQVRQMIAHDARFAAIQANRLARRQSEIENLGKD